MQDVEGIAYCCHPPDSSRGLAGIWIRLMSLIWTKVSSSNSIYHTAAGLEIIMCCQVDYILQWPFPKFS